MNESSYSYLIQSNQWVKLGNSQGPLKAYNILLCEKTFGLAIAL